jgi:hypothetical protein
MVVVYRYVVNVPACTCSTTTEMYSFLDDESDVKRVSRLIVGSIQVCACVYAGMKIERV